MNIFHTSSLQEIMGSAKRTSPSTCGDQNISGIRCVCGLTVVELYVNSFKGLEAKSECFLIQKFSHVDWFTR